MQIIANEQDTGISPGKIVCVGRNFADHARELGNPVPPTPLLFMKPGSCTVPFNNILQPPLHMGTLHHELEIAVLIDSPLSYADVTMVRQAISRIGMALDLTLRDVQNDLKAKGHPWERAKCFDGACPLSAFITIRQGMDLTNIRFQLEKNGKIQQSGNSRDMIFPILPLISHISATFSLQKGDIILCGTPKGVSSLAHGDHLKASLWIDNRPGLSANCTVE